MITFFFHKRRDGVWGYTCSIFFPFWPFRWHSSTFKAFNWGHTRSLLLRNIARKGIGDDMAHVALSIHLLS